MEFLKQSEIETEREKRERWVYLELEVGELGEERNSIVELRFEF